MFKANFSGHLKIEDMCKRGKHQALSSLYSWLNHYFPANTNRYLMAL